MSESRAQGRPRRGTAEVGREKIVLRLQELLRSGRDVDLSRKTLAECAGVTPALITYYFPKKEMLLEDLSFPIMHKYRLDMEHIIVEVSSNEQKLRQLVKVLVELYTRDRTLMDIYVSVMQRSGRSGNISRCEISRMTTILADFFSGWHGRPSSDGFDAAVLHGVVWGMCRFAARLDDEDDVAPLVARVVQLLTHSVGGAAL